MEFKIDTKPSYTIITPVTNVIDAKLTEAVRQKWGELSEAGSKNLIVDLRNALELDPTCFDGMSGLHEDFYTNSQSLVFANVPEGLIKEFKPLETDSPVNISPTMAEAIDIISMEILERDLFNEES
jgi:anti-anti-sigma regulatory factor